MDAARMAGVPNKLTIIALALVATCVAQEADTILRHVRDVEARIEATVYDSEHMVCYHSTMERTRPGINLSLYPYLSYSTLDSNVTLYGYLHIATSGWLLLRGAEVLVGDRRFTYTPDPKTVSDFWGHEVGKSGKQTACVEWLHIRARIRDSSLAMFKAIAAAPETVKVSIKAVGENASTDWEFTDSERRAWQDAVYYYLHFNKRNPKVSAFKR